MRGRRSFRCFVAISTLGALMLSTTALAAESWPQRPVRFVAPVGAGTGPDVAARVFAERLALRWRQPVVVENRPGADGLTGVSAFIGMRDDHALLLSYAAPISVFPSIHESLSYDPKRDLVPIASTADTFIGVAASSAAKVTTLAELVARARANPGKLNCYSSAGALPYLFAGFLKRQGLSITMVPYREQNPAVQDMAAGRLDCAVNTLASLVGGIQAGKVRLLAVTNSKRAPVLPDVPTATEAGFPELHFEGLVGLFGARMMTVERRDRIAADVIAVAAEPVVADRFAALGQIARARNSAEFAAAIEQQRAQMEDIVKLIGGKLPQ
jgi:tripartite-type tricarboxylate transporter receptor subunit TctC